MANLMGGVQGQPAALLHPSLHANAHSAAFGAKPAPSNLMAWDVTAQIVEQWQQHQGIMERMNSHVQQLQKAVENTRSAYNQVIQERDNLRQQLQSAEGRLAEVQRVVTRYTVVQDPVVASDGFTYERHVIQQYLDDCIREGQPAISQQTKEELKPNLVPNQSLKKLVELLKSVKPKEVPAVSASVDIPREEDSDSKKWKAKEPDTAGFKECSDLEAILRDNAKRDSDSKRAPPKGGKDATQKKLHPCLRVYGFCNYKDDCTFAMYPYEACLNHIKGKCRFGTNCKELHVNPNAREYQNPAAADRNNANGGTGANQFSGFRGRGR
jgi:hypothetical protein